MEISVPVELPVLDQKTENAISSSPVQPTTSEQKKVLEEKAKLYFEEKEVVPMLNALLTEVYVSQPEDPIDHMMRFLLRHPSLSELLNSGSEHDLLEGSDATVAYSNKYKLPQLFDEMLTALLDD
eukprot:403974_1